MFVTNHCLLSFELWNMKRFKSDQVHNHIPRTVKSLLFFWYDLKLKLGHIKRKLQKKHSLDQTFKHKLFFFKTLPNQISHEFILSILSSIFRSYQINGLILNKERKNWMNKTKKIKKNTAILGLPIIKHAKRWNSFSYKKHSSTHSTIGLCIAHNTSRSRMNERGTIELRFCVNCWCRYH